MTALSSPEPVTQPPVKLGIRSRHELSGAFAGAGLPPPELYPSRRSTLQIAGLARELHPPTEVHFKNGDRAPLLLVGATRDHTVPAPLTKAQYKRYEHSPAKTDYLEVEGRPHLHMVAPDWQEVAGAIDGWLDGVFHELGGAMLRAS